MRHYMERATKLKTPLVLLTDLETLINVVVNSSTNTEKCLMIAIRAAQEAFERNEIDDVGWIRTKDNIADGLKKIKR